MANGHDTAGPVHVAGGAAEGAAVSDDHNFWWDGTQWVAIDWSLAAHHYGADRAGQWGAWSADWKHFQEFAMAGAASNEHMSSPRRVEFASDVADAAMHFFHAHNDAVTAVVAEPGQPEHERMLFRENVPGTWIDAFRNSLTAHAANSHDPVAVAQDSARDADAMIQSRIEYHWFEEYQRNLHY